MPHSVKFDQPPAGYTFQDASGIEGQPLPVIVREFSSSDDGELFISRLEGLPSVLLGKLPVPIKPSQVDHLLAIIRKDLSTTLYLNELAFVIKGRATRAIAAGELVSEDDLADIVDLTFPGIDIPQDAAVVFLFSVNWRKGLFFDLAPLTAAGTLRDFDLHQSLGGFYAFLANQSVFNLTDADWKVLTDNGWFPFISLPKSLLRILVGRARGSGNLDILLPKIVDAVRQRLPQMLDHWAPIPEFAPHLDLIRHATQRFQDGDFISCVAITFPRIEGLLRSVHSKLQLTDQPKQGVLASCVLRAGGADLARYSWLLPDRFHQYLTDCYFAGFEPGQPARLSRHSIGHGVASTADFNEKHAAIGFLILDQISYLVTPPAK